MSSHYCNNCNIRVVEEGDEVKDNVKISVSPTNINYYCVNCVVMLINMVSGLMDESTLKKSVK